VPRRRVPGWAERRVRGGGTATWVLIRSPRCARCGTSMRY
jgi:hypothetical protein